MYYNEKRELKNADPPKTQERLELQGADSRENGNGEVLFKSVYPSSHRSSEAQLLCLYKGIKIAHEREIVSIALPSPPKIIEAACALHIAACALSTINVAAVAPHLAASAPDLKGIFCAYFGSISHT